MTTHDADIVVVGAGPTGMAASLEAARAGWTVVFVAPSGTHVDDDGRTTAVMTPGIALLERLGIWEELADKTAPLETLRIIDATDRLLRAPTVDFRASEVGEAAFGHNIRNSDLNAALARAVARNEAITTIDTMAAAADFGSDRVTVTCENGDTITARLAVAADGVNSLLRRAAAIEQRQWSYPQTAIVLTFRHSRAHHYTSSEFHTPQGPFTQVPLPGDESSLVWVMRPEQAEQMLTLDADTLATEVEKRMTSMLGRIEITSKAQAWPLSTKIAHTFSGERLVLVGHAAHAFPPIGAQGLNLGLRDIEDLGAALGHASGDPGAQAVTHQYHKARRADIWSRTAAVDLLNRSLLTNLLPVQAIRASGMSLLKHLPPLRSLMMREGMRPGSALKSPLERFSPLNRRGRDRAA